MSLKNCVTNITTGYTLGLQKANMCDGRILENDFIPALSVGDFPILKCEFFITIHFLQLDCILKISHYICSHTQIYMIYKI